MESTLESCDLLDSRQFLIAVRRLADDFGYGADQSPFLGAGVEYVQSRPYEPGDPVKAIDWRVTARTGKPFIKEYEAPKRMPCYLLVDTSASMTISSQRRSKYAVAVHIAGGIALACLDRISPVGMIAAGSRELRSEPSLSRDQIYRWLHELRTFRHDESTTLHHRVTRLSASLKSASLVIVLSDLHDPEALGTLKLLAQRHDVAVVQLEDPAEQLLPGSGLVRVREAETGREFTVRGSRGGWIDQCEAETQLKRGGIDHVLVRTDEPFSQLLRHFFRSRGVLGRGAR